MDAATLLGSLNPDAPLAHRHLWLMDALQWVRGDSSDAQASVARVRDSLDAVEANPVGRARWRRWWARFTGTVDLTPLLADHGFAPRTAFLSEFGNRLRKKVLPGTPETTNMAELFDLLLPSRFDVRWLKALDTATLQRVRTVLAAHEIDQIMLDRSRFGEAFTKEVQPQLGGWGVEAIKNIELMDIRDAKDSDVIHNIMAKRTSGIERESRLVVADNSRQAEMAEIAAKREIEMSRQLAAEQVGLRTAEKDKNVGVANEQASQQVKVQQRETAAKEMDVVQVNTVRGAEIAREAAVIAAAQAKDVAIVQADAAKQVAVVSAEGNKQVAIVVAEGQKQQTVLTAEGQLEAARRNAEGIALEGNAKGQAETAILMAPVDAQIKLAEKIGSDQGYQNYLLGIRNIEAAQAVGMAQAEALKSADVKVISNAGSPGKGLSSVMDLFSADGGTAIASMLEGLAQSPEGKKMLEKFAHKSDSKPDPTK